MQEQYLVGLHDPLPLAAGIAYQQVGVPHRLDRRAARGRDPVGQSGEAVGRALLVVADRVAHHRDLGVGVPVFEPVLAVVNLIARDAHRAATGKLKCVRFAALRRRRNGAGDRFSHGSILKLTVRTCNAGTANDRYTDLWLPLSAHRRSVASGISVRR